MGVTKCGFGGRKPDRYLTIVESQVYDSRNERREGLSLDALDRLDIYAEALADIQAICDAVLDADLAIRAIKRIVTDAVEEVALGVEG